MNLYRKSRLTTYVQLAVLVVLCWALLGLAVFGLADLLVRISEAS